MIFNMNHNNLSYSNKFNLFIFLGPSLSGISISVIFSVLLIPIRINIPITIVTSFLILWLTKYYFSNNYYTDDYVFDKTHVNNSNKSQIIYDKHFLKFLFVIIYSIFLTVTFFTSYNSNIFVPWSEFTLADAIKLTSSIGLSFIMHGYAIINIISRHSELENFLKFFLGYFISVLITGLCAYVTAAFGFAVSDNRNFILVIYATILILYAAINYNKIFKKNLLNFSYRKAAKNSIISLTKNMTVLMVFLSLLSIIIILTYYLFNGTIIGDQWFHHGRSLEFINGSFKDIDSTASDYYYPPLFSSLLSEFLVLSCIPSVNAFLSINFLIMPPILTFYFFVRKWLPSRTKKTALIATTLFTLSSGFGWIYAIQLAMCDPLYSQTSILEIFRIATLKAFDLNLANTFFATPHPSPHGSIALPAGFLLLSLLKINITSKLKYVLIFIVTTVGILSHDEFYLFILVSSSLLLIYRLNKTHIIFMSLLSSIAFVFILDTLLPVKYFTITEILGIPLIFLSFGFVLVMWGLYTSKIRNILGII